MVGLEPHVVWAVLAGVVHVLGVLSAVNALLSCRSSQSAIAWALSCVTFPYLAVPAYWLLGRNRLQGYVVSRRSSNSRFRELLGTLRAYAPTQTGLSRDLRQACRTFERLAGMPFTRANHCQLLVDGDEAFDAIFQRIEQAQDYILLQFFIVRDDALGRRMRDVLAQKVQDGVRVYFMYDQIGSRTLSKRYLASLRRAGITLRPFKTTHALRAHILINFRNHRKAVVVDGRWAVTGGMNLGDEYRGRSERFGHWRDTMIAVEGPAVQEIQLSFAEDWFFVTEEIAELDWQPRQAADGRQSVLVLPTGPADELYTCSLMFTQAIHSAEDRVWIVSPYFVPDNEIIRALQLAALRGVDVRVLLPQNPDHWLVYWASFTYFEELEKTGVKFYRYTGGMLHQKVVLVDDDIACVGTANMDNRTFYLNFELTVVVADQAFAGETAAMLEQDFAASRQAGGSDYKSRGLLFRLVARLSRLLSPIL